MAHIGRYRNIERMSGALFPALTPPGYLPTQLQGGRFAEIKCHTVQGRCWELDPRQVGLKWATGNHPHIEIVERGLGTPDKLWKELDPSSSKKGPSWVIGRFQGKPGEVKSPIEWRRLSFSEVPHSLHTPATWVTAALGPEAEMKNIVSHRVEGCDVVVTHITRDQDRRLIVINPDNWQAAHSERADLIEKQLAGVVIQEIERQELSPDGKTLILYSKVRDSNGQPLQQEIDISSLHLPKRWIYKNAADSEFTVKLVALDQRESVEVLGRERIGYFANQEIDIAPNGDIIRGFKDDQGVFHLKIDSTYSEDLGYAKIRASTQDDGSVNIIVVTDEDTFEIKGAKEWEIRGHEKFGLLSDTLRAAVLRGFHCAPPTEVTGKSWRELKRKLKGEFIPWSTRRLAKKVFWKIFDQDNFAPERPTKIRTRFALQFHECRETRFKDVLAEPLREGESVVITKALAAAEIVHLDETNGCPRGHREIVPLNFDPTNGHPEEYEHIIYDPRPHAHFKTGPCSPIGTALAGQHLIDPYVMGTEIMASVWPKIDQLGFFGIFMLATMAFPHGSMFTDPKNNPWFMRGISTISHSIFDAKSDAGLRYGFFTGRPILSKEIVGSGMVTGPNTDTANPVREGRLFYSRIPGRPRGIKTALFGNYILVIEDAWSSYAEMTTFGLKTATTILPLSAGGGLENYQTAAVQRDLRWNAGEDIFNMEAFQRMWEDIARGSWVYRVFYNHTKGLWCAEPNIIDPLAGVDGRLQLDTSLSFKAVNSPPPPPADRGVPLSEGKELFKLYLRKVIKNLAWLALPAAAALLLPAASAGIILAGLAVGVAASILWPLYALKKITGVPIRQLLAASEDDSSPQSEKVRRSKAFDPKRPVHRMYKFDEAREWLNVGTWYWVSAAKLATYISVPILITFALLPIPTVGLSFLLVCLGATALSWPFWALQMAKVGVNPKKILSFTPIHLFWQDLFIGTMAKASLDIERLGVGRFRISVRSMGNRVTAFNKRIAFWIGMVAPTAAGAGLIIATILLATGVGLVPVAITAAPFAVGFLLSKFTAKWAKRLIPNPHSRSFLKSSAQWLAKYAPLGIGLFCSAVLGPSFVVVAVPFALAVMAGGWAIFMGYNVFNDLWIYHKEQKTTFALPVPNVPSGTIKRYQADTWRNTFREAFGYNPPPLLPLEFTSESDPAISPYTLWEAVQEVQPDLLAAPSKDNPLVNLNTLIQGEVVKGQLVVYDLLHELRGQPQPVSLAHLEEVSRWNIFTRRGRIARLARQTADVRQTMKGLKRDERQAVMLNLDGATYDRLQELNRLVLEETFPEYAPRQ